jgi:hypothetical protein
MDTLNIVLMMILSVMIGFAIGNVYGKETAKKMFQTLIDSIAKHLGSEIMKKEE